MKKELSAMPAAFAVMFIWLAVWILTLFSEQIAPALWGIGISKIGNEYHRFLTAGLVHTDFIHLAANILSLFWIGHLYERRIGSARFLAVGAGCAVLAQVVFLCVFRNAEGCVGGSALNYALCGYALASQLLVPDFPKMKFGTWGGSWLIIYLTAANIPLLPFMNATTIILHAIAFVLGLAAALICSLPRRKFRH